MDVEEAGEPLALLPGSEESEGEAGRPSFRKAQAASSRCRQSALRSGLALALGLAAVLAAAAALAAARQDRRRTDNPAAAPEPDRPQGEVTDLYVGFTQPHAEFQCQAHPVYDFWSQTHTEHTFHFGDPWYGEIKGNVQFYAFPLQVAGTVPIWSFWNDRIKEHTYHTLPPWAGEQQEKVIFYAYPLHANASAQQASAQLVRSFWHQPNQEHTFHLGQPWPGESPGKAEFFAYSQEAMALAGCLTETDGVQTQLAPIVGVNLGGWLVLEDWMWAEEMQSKGIYDMWTFINKHGGPKDPRAVKLINQHWDTFVTEQDLDRLLAFGATHVRVPVGWWLVDYDEVDGFVDGGEAYLRRLLTWLKPRGMKALLDLHALPGGQAIGQSFTGRKSNLAEFFLSERQQQRGRRAMRKLAELILAYERDWRTSGVVWGMELVNEPDWRYWNTSPGIRELYEDMVPELRRLLPADRYYLFLNFQEYPRRTVSTRWLEKMVERDPVSFEGVVYDYHDYHSYGDDNNKEVGKWRFDEDACKTCCRDPVLLNPLVKAKLPIAVLEYSLTTGFAGNAGFFADFLHNQLSLWRSTPGMLGSFFWNHRILPAPGGMYREFSLLDLLAPAGPLPPVSALVLTPRCPNSDLSKCPVFDEETVAWNTDCWWLPSD